MTAEHPGHPEPPPPPRHPYAVEIDAERDGWHEIVALVRQLTPVECMESGYYRDPDWSTKDAVGHLGTWLAEAQVQLERIRSGTYTGHDVDVDAMNATFLEALHDQPWSVAWVQANAGRSLMLQAWYQLAKPDDEAAWWIRKCGSDHYDQHLPRLREWKEELLARRSR